MSDYQVKIFSVTGELRLALTDFERVEVAREVNAPGALRLELHGAHPAGAAIEARGQIEVWRRWAGQGIGWSREFCGIVLSKEYQVDEQGRETLSVVGAGLLTKLSWRRVLWYAGTVGRSTFTAQPAETVMKTLVATNAGGGATAAAGRLRDGTLAGLSVQADAGGGNVVDWSCAWANLLKTLQELAEIAGGDFDLVKTDANAGEFRWYGGQLGSDRREAVLFALERGNMARPKLTLDHSQERTAAIVGGMGEGSGRTVRIRYGADYAAGNDGELFVYANNLSGTGALDACGDAALRKCRARPALSFGVLQTPGCLYGKHYFLGDLVAARYRDYQGTAQVRRVELCMGRELETIRVEVTDRGAA